MLSMIAMSLSDLHTSVLQHSPASIALLPRARPSAVDHSCDLATMTRFGFVVALIGHIKAIKLTFIELRMVGLLAPYLDTHSLVC